MRFLDLNTSYVNVNRVLLDIMKSTHMDLNTSYVNVNHCYPYRLTKTKNNLNTSHVKVNHNVAFGKWGYSTI